MLGERVIVDRSGSLIRWERESRESRKWKIENGKAKYEIRNS